MTKQTAFTTSQVDWIELNLDTLSLPEIAEEFGVCVDTLKRQLVKLGLKEFDGAKFALPRDFSASYWRRPCIRCHGTDRRPKNQFICTQCKQTEHNY